MTADQQAQARCARRCPARSDGVLGGAPHLGLDVDLARAATGLGDLHNLDIGCDGACSIGNSRLVLVLLGLVELVLCVWQRDLEQNEELAVLGSSCGQQAISSVQLWSTGHFQRGSSHIQPRT